MSLKDIQEMDSKISAVYSEVHADLERLAPELRDAEKQLEEAREKRLRAIADGDDAGAKSCLKTMQECRGKIDNLRAAIGEELARLDTVEYNNALINEHSKNLFEERNKVNRLIGATQTFIGRGNTYRQQKRELQKRFGNLVKQ